VVCAYKKPYCLGLLLFFSLSLSAQSGVTYRLETFGSLSSGNYTPFWLNSNTYGVVPLKTNNGYLRSDVSWKNAFSDDWKFEAGIDLIAATNHTSSIWVQQLYGDISFRKIKLSIGSKERYNSMLNKRLSTGDMNYSMNARPIPEVNFSIPEYMTVPFTKDILQLKADFAVGKSWDNNYIEETKQKTAPYAKDILWHHKSLFFHMEDPEGSFPFVFTFGLDHAVQWGGWTSYSEFGDLPHSPKDFLRIVLGKQGGESAVDGDQINVLGNHQGTYNLKFGYKHRLFETTFYKQHYFDDNSGMEYANWRDGIWGTEIKFLNQSYLKQIVLEYIQTTNQSGPMHFLDYDPDRNVRGGGNDDYYNHDFYYSGWSYYGRTLGNPLLTSPEYNTDNALFFKNNRIKAVHLGMEGNVTPEIDYRTLFTGMQSWGRMRRPFLDRKDNFSMLIECNYQSDRLRNWALRVQIALDKGDLYEDNFGVSMKITKSGAFSF
jgi:hypothetical protein